MKQRKRLWFLVIFSLFISQFFIIDTTLSENEHENEYANEKIIGPLLLEKIGVSNDLSEETDVIILIKEGYFLHEIDQLRYLNIIRRFELINGIVCKISLNRVLKLSKLKEIQGIWIDRPEFAIPDDNIKSQIIKMVESSNSEGSFVNFTDEVGATDLWKKGINGTGSVIAILDSGVDLTGQIGGDLDDFDENPSTYDAKFVGAVSLVPEEPLYYTDFNGRGTFHAGVATGTGYYNESCKGIAPGSHYLNVKVYDTFGLTYWSFLISGVEWSIQHSADVILFCSDIPGLYFDPISLAITNAVKKGIVIVVPTGDDGPSYMSLTSPGAAQAAISVGAYNSYTNLVANFSGRGPGFDFCVGPDLVAPGVNLIGPRSKILTNESLNLLKDLSSLLNFAGSGMEIDTNIVFSLPNGIFPTPSYGTHVDPNYTRSSGTGAAASIVAGCVALLIQAFPLANPQLIRTALCDTAHPILGDSNSEGFGLVNVSAAYEFLQNYFDKQSFIKIPYSAPLIYTGFVSTSDSANWTKTLNDSTLAGVNAYDLNALVSTQLLFDALIVSNGTEKLDFTQIHLPINQFGFEYAGRVHWLSEFNVLREFHQISSSNIGEDDYNRFLGILELNGLIVTAIVETWNYIAEVGPFDIPIYEDRVNGYKISLNILNLRDSPGIYDLSLISYFRSDLFANETGAITLNNSGGLSSILDVGLDDICTFDSSLETMLVSDLNNNSEYSYSSNYATLGFNSTSHSLNSYKISESITLFADLTLNGTENGYLDNSTSYILGEEDPGFAMKWHLTNELSYGQALEFSSILSLGIGDSFTAAETSLKEQMRYINSRVSFYPIQDIVVAKAEFERMAPVDKIYSSTALILNVGNTKINRSNLVFAANRTTNEGYIEVYSKISSIRDFDVRDYHYVTQQWTPLEQGIYLTGWVAIIPVILGLEREENLLNNFLFRNVYIFSEFQYQSILKETFRTHPVKLDANPMKIRFPGDVGLFNITTYGILEIPDVTVSISSSGKQFMKLMWFGPDIISQLLNESTQNSSSFEEFSDVIYTHTMDPFDTIFCLTIGPLFCPPSVVRFNITFSSPIFGGIFYVIPVELEFSEFQGRIFFDGIHNFLSMEKNFANITKEIGNVDLTQIIDLEERLDYPYGNFFDFAQLWSTIRPKGTTIQTFFPGITIEISDYISNFNSIINGEINSSEEGGFLDVSFMQKLLGGYSFEREFLSTNTIHHDLLQFYDVLIVNDPEISLIDEEIEDIIEWVEKGGCLIVWAENSTENDSDSLNSLLGYANLSISSQSIVNGPISISDDTWNASKTIFSEYEIGTLVLRDPVQLTINSNSYGRANLVEILCEEGYMAAAHLNRGRVFVSGDKDIFTIQGLSQANNSEFAAFLLDFALGNQFDIEITLSQNPVSLWNITYFDAKISNYEDISELLAEGILFISAFMYQDSTIVNISFFGFLLPAFVVFPTNISNYAMYYDTTWYNVTGNYYAMFVLDHPAIAQEIIYVPFKVDPGQPPPEIDPYIFPQAAYPFWVDMIGILWIIGMGLLIWFYHNEKWKTRLNIIQLKGDLLNQAKTKINEGKSLMKQILQGLEITQDEQEQIRFVLRNRKRVRKYMRELRQFGEKIGEHYD